MPLTVNANGRNAKITQIGPFVFLVHIEFDEKHPWTRDITGHNSTKTSVTLFEEVGQEICSINNLPKLEDSVWGCEILSGTRGCLKVVVMPENYWLDTTIESFGEWLEKIGIIMG